MPNADQHVIDTDEQLKDVASGLLIEQSVPLVLAQDPKDSPSRLIRVPTLVVLGEQDMTASGPDGIVCTDETVKSAEAPYYPVVPGGIDVHVVAKTGHSLPLHRNGRSTTDFIIDWVNRRGGANPR
jgi:pimeloyl-ACP methyl ester carboxylesterase